MGIHNIYMHTLGMWQGYAFCLIGILHLSRFFYAYYLPYISIENTYVTKRSYLFRTTRIEFSAITDITFYKEKITLLTGNQKITIDTSLIDKNAQEEIMNILYDLDLPQ